MYIHIHTCIPTYNHTYGHLEVGGIDAHSLLAHSRLVCVARRLVVVGKRNDTVTSSQKSALSSTHIARFMGS
jgi:hypothetical protein